ncbi:MAG: hypothetical protein U5K31_08850 [Balneolaceae bacterium]|nr:hypothetical protein [Balneolaceae bacterium]
MAPIRFKHAGHWQNLSHLVKQLQLIEALSVSDRVEVASQGFATPFQVIPLACVINAKKLSPYVKNEHSDIAAYLNTIRFPTGIRAEEATPGASGNYLPIARISDAKSPGSRSEESYKHLEDQYRELILSCFPAIREKLSNAIAFFLSELIENAKDHSEAKNFYIFAQYWPALGEFELCMMDDGIGLRGSLSKRYEHVTTDEIAVREVIQRQLSARISEVEALPGTGLANTIRIVTNKELVSTFTLLSGNYGYSCSNDQCRWVKPGTLSLSGTLINIRLKEPKERLNIFSYIQ